MNLDEEIVLKKEIPLEGTDKFLYYSLPISKRDLLKAVIPIIREQYSKWGSYSYDEEVTEFVNYLEEITK